MTRDEIIAEMHLTADETINTMLSLMVAIPDETTKEAREAFGRLQGKPLTVVAQGLRELAATPLTPLAMEYTQRIIGFVDLARFTYSMTIKI
jgi:hypothetical protein